MSSPTRVCIDLFCGLGGFSAAFEDSDGWEVYTVDIEAEFDPDLCADVMDLRPSDLFDLIGYDRDEIDLFVVLASPPCTDFSIAASRYEKIVDGEPQTDSARESVALVYHALGLIRSVSSDYWFMENPRGYLRQIIGRPTGTVTYCQYGEDYMKPTDLWGDHPRGFSYLSCTTGSDCHAYNTDGEHGGRGNCEVMDENKSVIQQTTGDAAIRSIVPYDLSDSIREAVEDAHAGELECDASLERWA